MKSKEKVYKIDSPETFKMYTPTYEWEVWFDKKGTLRLMYEKDAVPNIFFRIMGRLLLGFKWINLKNK